MSDETQALCFLAGANSIFYGEKLLTTGNPDVERDRQLFARLGLKPEQRPAQVTESAGTAAHSHACAHAPDSAAANA
jgi:biotin synthase